jgi:long-chain fatty acid transport protein
MNQICVYLIKQEYQSINSLNAKIYSFAGFFYWRWLFLFKSSCKEGNFPSLKNLIINTKERSMSKRIFATAVVCVLMVSTVFASNGYFSHGYGTQYKSMAGAGVGLSLNSLASATNPASIASVGARVDVSAAMFSPARSYTITGNPSGYPGTFGLAPGKVESGSSSFVVPSAGVSLSLPGNSAVGLAIYGNGGMNTDYDSPTFGASPTGVNLMQLFVGATYAKKVMDKHSIGVTGLFAWQSFEAKGLGAFGMFSSDASNLTNNDASTATGFGVRVGYLGDILPILSIGASYQSKINMGEFEEYAGLFAEQGGFDIPANWTIGLALKATPILTIAADMQKIMYSEIKSIANSMLPNLQTAQLGTENGAGFGWQDMTVYKIGAQLSLIPGLTLRAGYSMTDQPIPAETVMFNILAPGVIEKHVTFGVTKSILPTIKLHLAVMKALSNSVSGANPLEAPGQQTIELEMDQWDAELGLSFSL